MLASMFTPGSPEELAAFAALQRRTPDLFRILSADAATPQTCVIVPSLSLPTRELNKVTGVWHYEERMLVNLMLLKQPRTKVIYVTSSAIDPGIVDYYLAMLPGVPASHARPRLVMLHCADSSVAPLTEKILRRPRLIERIRQEIDHPETSHLVCFNSSALERSLAVRLGLPLHAVDPALYDLGTKSGSREVFRAAGIDFPFGFERLRDPQDVARAFAAVRRARPTARRAVTKLNDGFSGEGNAVLSFDGLDPALSEDALTARILDRLPTHLQYVSASETWEDWSTSLRDMQGVVEEWIDGEVKASPSVQCRVNALGEPQAISTHDQVLGGVDGQVFLGARFPADGAYRTDVQASALQVADELARRGVIGRFGIDYVSVLGARGWQHFAIEINLRKGGTTHPFLTLKFLTDGRYDASRGTFHSASGAEKFYFASDNITSQRYVGLRPDDLIDIAVLHGLLFHAPTERGVVFHLMGALSQFGKVGLVAIGDSAEDAEELAARAVAALDQETA
jgi:hypothetical protein